MDYLQVMAKVILVIKLQVGEILVEDILRFLLRTIIVICGLLIKLAVVLTQLGESYGMMEMMVRVQD